MPFKEPVQLSEHTRQIPGKRLAGKHVWQPLVRAHWNHRHCKNTDCLLNDSGTHASLRGIGLLHACETSARALDFTSVRATVSDLPCGLDCAELLPYRCRDQTSLQSRERSRQRSADCLLRVQMAQLQHGFQQDVHFHVCRLCRRGTPDKDTPEWTIGAVFGLSSRQRSAP